jgi:uncharacterized protein
MTKSKKQLFVLRRSTIQGTGAFAVRRIRKGQRIIEYTGERIDQKEADRRYDDEAMRRHHTFLFAIEDDVILDAARGGNDARFINHSCDPNCQAVDEDGRIFIEAIRNIQPGTELTYDYRFERDPDDPDDREKLYPCNCGTARCRGTLLAPPKRKRKRTRKAAQKNNRVVKPRTNKSSGRAPTRRKQSRTKRRSGAAR